MQGRGTTKVVAAKWYLTFTLQTKMRQPTVSFMQIIVISSTQNWRHQKPGLPQRLITPMLNSRTVPGCYHLRTTEHRNSVWPRSSALYCSIHLKRHNAIAWERRNTADRSGPEAQQHVVFETSLSTALWEKKKKVKDCNRICSNEI